MHMTSAIAVAIVVTAAVQAWLLLRGRGNPAVEQPAPPVLTAPQEEERVG
jgi:DHA2 family multidrug resistance protein-like MFS transporter